MVESDVKMAYWTWTSFAGCAGISPSSLLFGKGILTRSAPVDASAVLGPLRMPRDIDNRKRLLTKQCSHPNLGVPVLVEACLPFANSEALHDGEQGSKEAVGSEDSEKEVAVVVGVERVDVGLVKRCDPLSGEQVHPQFSSRWKNLVIRSESWRWDLSASFLASSKRCDLNSFVAIRICSETNGEPKTLLTKQRGRNPCELKMRDAIQFA